MTLSPREPLVLAWFQTLIWVTEMLPKGAVFIFFLLLLLTEALSLPIFRPCVWIWRWPIYNTTRKSEVASFVLYWDRLMGEHCKSLYLILLQIVLCAEEGELVPFSTMKKKSLDKLHMWESKSSPYVKSGILPALFLYEKVTHVCKLEKSAPGEEVILHNSRSRKLKEWLLWSLPTQDASLCCVP